MIWFYVGACSLCVFRQRFVPFHEFGNAVALGHLQRKAVGAHDGAVVGAVGFEEGGVEEAVVAVEVGKRGFGILGAGVEDGLCGFGDGAALLIGRCRPRECIVDV